jgi:hypothetical protein
VHVAVAALGRRGDAGTGRQHRIVAQHRELLEHQADIAVALDLVEQRRHHPLAVAAAVVEELHDGDVALRVAGDEAPRRIVQPVGVGDDHAARPLGLRHLLAFLHLLQGFHDHLRMFDQVFADDGFDLGPAQAGGRIGIRRL